MKEIKAVSEALKYLSDFNWDFNWGSLLIGFIFFPLAIGIFSIIPKYLKSFYNYIIEAFIYKISSLCKAKLSYYVSLRRYCRLELQKENKYLFVPSTQDIKLEVDKVFITLTLEDQGSINKQYNHTDILTVGNRIRIIGDPGSGKSSLVKRLFRDACHQAIVKSSKSKLPILLELKNLEIPKKASNLGDWLYEKLQSEMQHNAVYRMEECFDAYVKDAGLLVLLDGLDEVSTLHYQKIHNAIEDLNKKLAELSENNVIVLTMRTQFHQVVKDSFRNNFGKAVFVKPFNPSDIYKFLNNWSFEKNTKNHVNRIYKELTDRPTLREMCTNPLILSMYVANNQNDRQTIPPESRTDFYKKVTDELVIYRRLKQKGAIPASPKLQEQRERILGKLAFDNLLDANQPINSLDWSKAIAVICEIMACSEEQAVTLFYELSKETGLITEERPRQTFRFIHLTFCEFFAAYEAVQGQDDGWQRLVKTHKKFKNSSEIQFRTRLIEVIPFSCKLMPRKQRDSAITDIHKLTDKKLLARCFLETKQYEHSAWAEFIEQEKNSLLTTPESEWNNKWLQDLHLFNILVRDANECANYSNFGKEINLEEFFQSLIHQQQESLGKLLSAYAEQDAAATFRLAELCHINLAKSFPNIVIKSCEQLPFFSLMIEQTLEDLENIELYACLLCEAALCSEVTTNFLKKIESKRSLVSFVKSARIDKKWCFGRERLYNQLLTISANSNISIEPLKILKLIRNITAIGFYNSILIFYIILILAGVLTPVITFILSNNLSLHLNLNFYFFFEFLILYICMIRFLVILYPYNFISFKKMEKMEKMEEMEINKFLFNFFHFFGNKNTKTIISTILQLRNNKNRELDSE